MTIQAKFNDENQGGPRATEAGGRPNPDGSTSSSIGAGSGGAVFRIGRWEMRPDHDSWILGEYNDRDRRLKHPAYPHYLGHGLWRLHNRLTLDGFRAMELSTVEALMGLHDEQYRSIMAAFGHLRSREFAS